MEYFLPHVYFSLLHVDFLRVSLLTTTFCYTPNDLLVSMRLTETSRWNTSSHMITEVQQCLASSVPRWVKIWEIQML